MAGKILKLIKPFDLVIITALFLFSLSLIILSIKIGGDKHFFLYVDDKRIELKGKEGIIDLKDYGKNIILEVGDGKARFLESDCNDKICIKTGYIQKCGEVAVCLPNRVAIEIKCIENEFDAISQ